MKIQNVRGVYDFLPKEQKVRNYINEVIIKNFKQFGFQSIETSVLCYFDMLSDKYDEDNDILKEIYRLNDRGNRDLGLRYDLTVPFAKFIALNKNNINFPFKRYEIAKVFRDGPVRVGRDREFVQCDADVAGIEGQLIEAELLSMYVKTFKELNIEIYIKYNNRKLMNGLILEAGIDEALLQSVTTIVDKKDKVSKDEFVDMFKEVGLTEEVIANLNNFFSMSVDELGKKFSKSSNQNIVDGLKEINDLSNYLEKLNIGDVCNVDTTLARGQNYYTGNVFEVYDKKQRVKGSIGAGGRYDQMVTEYINDGNEYPTVGLSFGLSAIYEILKSDFKDTYSETDIYIIPMGTESESLKIANALRDNGYAVEIDMSNKRLRKSLDYANKEKIKYVIILGTNEIERGKLVIKDMVKGDDIEVSIDELGDVKLK